MSSTNAGSPLLLAGQQSQIVKALGGEGIARLVPAAQDVTYTVLRGLWGRGAGDC